MKRIVDYAECKQDICRHPEHNPPNMIVLKPGVYEHECPACSKVQRIIIKPKSRL